MSHLDPCKKNWDMEAKLLIYYFEIALYSTSLAQVKTYEVQKKARLKWCKKVSLAQKLFVQLSLQLTALQMETP